MRLSTFCGLYRDTEQLCHSGIHGDCPCVCVGGCVGVCGGVWGCVWGVCKGVRVHASAYAHVCVCVHLRLHVYKCRNAELSGIRSVQYQNEKI